MHVNLLFKKIAALIPCLLLTVALNAQTVTKAFRSVPLKTVLEEVERQTGYSILFENEDVDVSRPVTATFKDATLQTVLDTVLDKSLRYTVKGGGKLVTISRRSPVSAPTAPNGEMTVAGTVISSADNQPIVGANIYVEGTNVGTTTDAGGNYKLTVPASAKTVTVSFLGYDTKKISVRDIHLFKLITLADASNKLEDVVVVGFGVQKKESLVGAVQSVKPSDLQTSSSNLSTSFSGKIAGVIAVQKSGEPGADGAKFLDPRNLDLRIGTVAAADPRRRGNHRPDAQQHPARDHRVVLGAQGRHGNSPLRITRRQRRDAHHHQEWPRFGEDDR